MHCVYASSVYIIYVLYEVDILIKVRCLFCVLSTIGLSFFLGTSFIVDVINLDSVSVLC